MTVEGISGASSSTQTQAEAPKKDVEAPKESKNTELAAAEASNAEPQQKPTQSGQTTVA